MTEAEFITILGPDWELSKGKVDWFSYAQGKVSKEYVRLFITHPHSTAMLIAHLKAPQSLLVPVGLISTS